MSVDNKGALLSADASFFSFSKKAQALLNKLRCLFLQEESAWLWNFGGPLRSYTSSRSFLFNYFYRGRLLTRCVMAKQAENFAKEGR